MNVAPFVPPLSAQIFPSCTSIDFLQSARPMPLPPAGVLVLESEVSDQALQNHDAIIGHDATEIANSGCTIYLD